MNPAFFSPFPTTRWTLLRRLESDSARSGVMEELCRSYWKPVYAYLCRTGRQDQAEDLTQEFLLLVMRQNLFSRASPEGGRMRSWLLRSLELFLCNVRRSAGAARRGGGLRLLSLESESLRQEISRLAAATATPEEAFDMVWLQELISATVESLAASYAEAGKAKFYQTALPWLLHEAEHADQLAAAAACGMTLNHFRVQVHRLRARYRDALRARIAGTTAGESELREELNHLLRISARSL